MSKIQRKNVTLKSIYADTDLAEWELFAGNYINFGFWQEIDLSKPISIEDRVKASRALYEKVFSKFPITFKRNLAEVGCGHGCGALALLQRDKNINLSLVDMFEEQLQRARETILNAHADLEHVRFIQADREHFGLKKSSYDIIFSIEAAQHFESLETFSNAALSALKPGGSLVVTTYFLQTGSLEKVNQYLPWVGTEFETGHTINYFERSLVDAGFKNVSVESIGDHVWNGFDSWVSNTTHKDKPERNWLKAFNENLLDYYIVSAKKAPL